MAASTGMPTSNATAALVRFFRLNAVVVSLPCALVFAGCASADDADSGNADDDLTSLTSAAHGTMVQKCLDTESTALQANPANITATRVEAKKCLTTANDKIVRQLDARRGRTAEPAANQFKLFRTAANAACVKYVDAVAQVGGDAPGLRSDCGYHVENAMARLIQTYAELGGPPYATLWGIRRNEHSECYTAANALASRACVEKAVEQTIVNVSSASLRATVKAINEGNVALCETLVTRKTKAATTKAQDECRAEAAIFLEQLEALQPR